MRSDFLCTTIAHLLCACALCVYFGSCVQAERLLQPLLSHSNARLKLVITGPPAAGKSTQSVILKQRHGLLHLSSGDLLRAEVARGTKVGVKIQAIVEKGNMVEDEIILQLVHDRLRRLENRHRGWILDGFPRTLSQAMLLRDLGYQPDFVVHIPVSQEEILCRTSQRIWDPATGQTYHAKLRPPPVSGVLKRRSDDTADIAARRYQEYMRDEGPLHQFYGDRLVHVQGNKSIEEVTAALDAAIQSRTRTRNSHDRSGEHSTTQASSASKRDI